MKGRIILLLCLVFGAYQVKAQKAVVKTNSMKVYMHYMPWFETPETIGRWGWHWTMNTKNPNKVDATGKREIASHFYPLIGPYASRDKDVIEYHLLLMKLSGIDGVLINWYGVQGSNGDIKDLLTSSDSIAAHVDDFGMQFGVVMEDRFSRSLADVKANMARLGDTYFKSPAYIRMGAGQDPLVAIFGPNKFQKPTDWNQIMPAAGEDVEFLTLWYESNEAGTNADGEYAWVFQDNTNHLTHLDNFYKSRAPQLKTVMGAAYPGFYDFYKEGGSGEGYFYIPHNNGATLDQTLAKANQYKSAIDMLQLITWNDYGEGTIFEPTVETGFEYLKKVQAFTGVPYGEEELKLVYKLYRLRKEKANDPGAQQQLDLVAKHFSNLEINEAKAILDQYELVTGLLDNRRDKDDMLVQVYPNPLVSKILFIKIGRVSGNLAQLSILDLSGKVLCEKEYSRGASAMSISVEEFKSGIYVIRIQSGNLISTKKIVVSR